MPSRGQYHSTAQGVFTRSSPREPITTRVASSSDSQVLVGENPKRSGLSIYNMSASPLYLCFTEEAAIADCFMMMAPQSFLLLDQQLIVANAITGVWSAANGYAQVTEYT